MQNCFAAKQNLGDNITMKLEEAVTLIKNYSERMNELFGSVVFDEWAVVSFANKTGRILSYSGPRKDGFQKDFARDVEELRSDLLTKTHEAGDFEFAWHGTGQRLDAFTVVGPQIYVIWNNTIQSMQGISKEGRWLKAQGTFLELAEKFRADSVIE